MSKRELERDSLVATSPFLQARKYVRFDDPDVLTASPADTRSPQ